MKTLKMKQLDETEEEIADALISLGLGRNAAMTLVYMQNTNSATSLELERSARLRQPEVSIAMKQLEERGWITEREEKKPGKGRPYKVYSLKVDFSEIVTQLENKHRKEVDKAREKIERLRELGTV